jgi:transcriptional antiterminator Rof (Rho-off)
MNARLMCISHTPKTYTLRSGERVTGYVNYTDAKSIELIVDGTTRLIMRDEIR